MFFFVTAYRDIGVLESRDTQRVRGSARNADVGVGQVELQMVILATGCQMEETVR